MDAVFIALVGDKLFCLFEVLTAQKSVPSAIKTAFMLTSRQLTYPEQQAVIILNIR